MQKNEAMKMYKSGFVAICRHKIGNTILINSMQAIAFIAKSNVFILKK